MEFTEIDRQFDEAFERLQRTAPPVATAYGSSPLAADHFLLKKSWDYFRNRVKSIEEQWKKMLEAKDHQYRAVFAELTDARKRQVELEEENNLLRSLDHSVKKARADDYIGFAKKSENLRLHWDAERDALHRKIEALETKIVQTKKAGELRISTTMAREEKLKETIALLRKEADMWAERESDIKKKCGDELVLKDEKIHSLDAKVDLLRTEIEHRDQVIKRLTDAVTTHEKDSVAMTAYVAELQRALKEKQLDLANLQTQLAIAHQDKKNLQTGWERERAEWRELWDRGRSLWDKKS